MTRPRIPGALASGVLMLVVLPVTAAGGLGGRTPGATMVGALADLSGAGSPARGGPTRDGPARGAPGQIVDYQAWYLPLTVSGGAMPSGPDPEPTRVPPTAQTPDPTPGTPTATPTPVEAAVVFQIATYGGLAQDILLGDYIPHQTPTFTLFEDGTYIRRQRTVEVDRVRVTWLRGRLAAEPMDGLLARLVVGARFFEIPAEPPPMSCATDGPTDHLYLSTAEGMHRVHVYGLTWYNPEHTCGWPVAENLVVLASAVSDLEYPLGSGQEEELEIQAGTLAATSGSVDDAGAWPVADIRLADMPDMGWYRQLAVEGDLARQVAGAIEPHGWDGTLAWFEEEGQDWLVGFRLEFPGWDAYR